MVCDLLEVSTLGYFAQLRRQGGKPSKPGTNRRISNEALLAHIRDIRAEVRGEYGWPKLWKELVASGIRVGKEHVRRMMQEHGIKARGKRKFVVTTDSKHDLPITTNLLQRNFTAADPNQVCRGDITPEAKQAAAIGPLKSRFSKYFARLSRRQSGAIQRSRDICPQRNYIFTLQKKKSLLAIR